MAHGGGLVNTVNITRMEVSEPWYSYLRNSRKRVEGRKASPAWNHLQVGDALDIVCRERPTEHFVAPIMAIHYYHSADPLFDYLMGEGLQQVLPGSSSLTRGIATYLQWSTIQEIEQYGFMAIEIKAPTI